MLKNFLPAVIQHYESEVFPARTLAVTPAEADVLGQLFVDWCIDNHFDEQFLVTSLTKMRNPETKHYSGDRLLEWMVMHGWEVFDLTTSLKLGCTLTKNGVQLTVPFNPASPAYNPLLLEALQVVSEVDGIDKALLSRLIDKRELNPFEPLVADKLGQYEAIVRLLLKDWGTYEVTLIDQTRVATPQVFRGQSGFGVTVKDAALVIYTNNGNRWAVPSTRETLIQTSETTLLFVWKAAGDSHFQTLSFLQA